MQNNQMSSTEKKYACADCPIRRRAEANPRTLFARIWRWHTGWCPGWKAYQASLATQAKL